MCGGDGRLMMVMSKVVVMVRVVMASGDNGDGEGGGVVVACDGDGDYGDSEVVVAWWCVVSSGVWSPVQWYLVQWPCCGLTLALFWKKMLGTFVFNKP